MLFQLLILFVEGVGRYVGAVDITLCYALGGDPVLKSTDIRPLGAICLLFLGIDVPGDLEVPGFIGA